MAREAFHAAACPPNTWPRCITFLSVHCTIAELTIINIYFINYNEIEIMNSYTIGLNLGMSKEKIKAKDAVIR
jgi:hypothetical protein